MGCHCWTYKNVESLTDEEKRCLVNKEIYELKNWWGFKKSAEKVISIVKNGLTTISKVCIKM